MLHEILLSLSGQPSPLFETHAEEDAVSEDAFPLLSPPEKALLASLARLSRLHAKLRAHTALISASHHSVICRAASTAINTQHLGDFQRKVLEVEKSILVEDSGTARRPGWCASLSCCNVGNPVTCCRLASISWNLGRIKCREFCKLRLARSTDDVVGSACSLG